MNMSQRQAKDRAQIMKDRFWRTLSNTLEQLLKEGLVNKKTTVKKLQKLAGKELKK